MAAARRHLVEDKFSEHFMLKPAEQYILIFGGFGVSVCFGGVFCKALVALQKWFVLFKWKKQSWN